MVGVEAAEEKVGGERGEKKERKEEEPSNHLKQPRHGALNVCNLVYNVWKERRPGGGAAAAAIAVVDDDVFDNVDVDVDDVDDVFVVGGDAAAAATAAKGG